MVISAQHPRLMELVTKKQENEVEEFLKKIKSTSEKELLEKEGVFTGSYAVNPLTNARVPIYAGNFVVAEYGSGMVMAVPGHDQRDFEFAKKYNLPVKIVIQPKDKRKVEEAYINEGILVNSDKFSGMESKKAIEEITKFLESKKLGKRIVQYKLRDWLISRQRYWGTPIPVIYCDKCGIVPVPEKELPVKLPEKVEFGKGNPLETNKEFVNVKCPKCKGKARRETDTMDTFVNSSWYFLRYCDNKNNKEIFDKKKIKYWMPIDLYIGGKEHACMHLIYFRFYTKFLRDLGLLDIDEPTYRLFNQGMLHGNDGYVMSKSRGNVINPLEIIDKYGADTLRFYLVSVASPDKDFLWSDEAIEGSFRFINRVVEYFEKVKVGKSNKRVESKFNKTIKDITEDIENLKYNLAVIKIRELFEGLGEKESKEILEGFLKSLSVFCPHIAEELWNKLGNKTFISLEKWPRCDESKIDKKFEEQEKQTEKTVNDIRNIFKIIGKEAKKVFLYAIPKEVEIYKGIKDEIEKALNVKLEVYAVNDAKKHDPENKSGKAKLGKPAIYVE